MRRGARCKGRYKRVRSKFGGTVLRCADFTKPRKGGYKRRGKGRKSTYKRRGRSTSYRRAGARGRHCRIWMMTPRGWRCASFKGKVTKYRGPIRYYTATEKRQLQAAARKVKKGRTTWRPATSWGGGGSRTPANPTMWDRTPRKFWLGTGS